MLKRRINYYNLFNYISSGTQINLLLKIFHILKIYIVLTICLFFNKNEKNIGFEGRTFLLELEWNTYCRRKPVRFINKEKELNCFICGLPSAINNPLQNAHIISFDMGIIDLGLTPEFLDSNFNIKTAHKLICNKKVELNLNNAIIFLKSKNINECPSFLAESIKELWDIL